MEHPHHTVGVLLNPNNHSDAIPWHIAACHVSLLHVTCSWPGSPPPSELRCSSLARDSLCWSPWSPTQSAEGLPPCHLLTAAAVFMSQ